MHVINIALVCTLTLSVTVSSAMAEPPLLSMDDFAYGTELTSAENEFRRVTLSGNMIKDVLRRDLGDIRVFDEGNELMPVYLRKKDQGIKSKQRLLTQISRVIINGDTGYILDRTTGNKDWLESLHLQWKQGKNPIILSMRIEHSDDQSNWEVLKNSATVNNYKFNNTLLKQNVIDVDNFTRRYIKLTFLNTRYTPALASVTAHVKSKRPSAATWLSAGTLQPQLGIPNSYSFKASEGVNPDLLRFGFKELNTLLSGSLYTVSNFDGKLERKVAISNFNSYKTTLNSKVVKSKPIDVSQWRSAEWHITANAASNIKADSLPEVMVSYPQYEVIFAADGDEPYTLVWGNREAGNPTDSDIVKRLKADKKSLKDIAVVSSGHILNKAELTALMESRRWPWLLIIIALIGVAAFAGKAAYQRHQTDKNKTT